MTKRLKPGVVPLLSALLFAAALPELSAASDAGPGDGVGSRDEILEEVFRKELVKVTDGVFVAVGYGAANSTLLVGDDGVIIVDTMYGTEAAEGVRSAFREITAAPVAAIIHTHGHSDHIGGTSVFAEGGTPPIYARLRSEAALPGYEKLGDVLRARGRRQFGSDLPPELKIDGIAPVVRPTGGVGEGKMAPTVILESEREQLRIAGLDLELVAAPGETSDHLFVWVPEKRALICGDNFYASFPNLYAIRGTPYRDVTRWMASLDLILARHPEFLISGHARPIRGEAEVRRALESYRDAMASILDQTLRGMNEGRSPNELASSIRLPEALAREPYLQEFYGVIPWAVRSIYGGYVGWFDGNPTQLFPLSPIEEAERMVTLVGSKAAVMDAARQATESRDLQWACQLVDHLLVLDPDDAAAKALKARALTALADEQISSNARHYYLSAARELTGEAP